jgi:hypothetical protein
MNFATFLVLLLSAAIRVSSLDDGENTPDVLNEFIGESSTTQENDHRRMKGQRDLTITKEMLRSSFFDMQLNRKSGKGSNGDGGKGSNGDVGKGSNGDADKGGGKGGKKSGKKGGLDMSPAASPNMSPTTGCGSPTCGTPTCTGTTGCGSAVGTKAPVPTCTGTTGCGTPTCTGTTGCGTPTCTGTTGCGTPTCTGGCFTPAMTPVESPAMISSKGGSGKKGSSSGSASNEVKGGKKRKGGGKKGRSGGKGGKKGIDAFFPPAASPTGGSCGSDDDSPCNGGNGGNNGGGGGNSTCGCEIDKVELDFTMLPFNISVPVSSSSENSAVGTVFVFGDPLFDLNLTILDGTFVGGLCHKTQLTQPAGSSTTLVGGGYCFFTFTVSDGTTSVTFNAVGEVFDVLGGTLAITGGTGELTGVYGEVELTPVYETEDLVDFFTEASVYVGAASLFVPLF